MQPSPAAALSDNPFTWTAGPFLLLYAALVVVALVASWLARTYVRFGPRPARGDGLCVVDLAYLSNGSARAADAVVLGFLDAGAASLTGDGRIALRTAWADLPAFLEPYRGCGAGLETRRNLVRLLAARLDPVRNALVARGLVLAGRASWPLRVATLAPVGAVLAFGVVEVVVGLLRGEAVGLLLVLMAGMMLVAMTAFTRSVDRTGVGDRVLADYRARFARVARSPTDAEILSRFALTGEAALIGTAHESYAALIVPADGGHAGRDAGDEG